MDNKLRSWEFKILQQARSIIIQKNYPDDELCKYTAEFITVVLQVIILHFYSLPSPLTSRGKWLPLPELLSCKRGVFPSHCRKRGRLIAEAFSVLLSGLYLTI